MLGRVNLPRRRKQSSGEIPFGTYRLFYSDGSNETLHTSAVLQMSDYPDVTKALALNGGTIVASNAGVTLGGNGELSLVGSSAWNSNDYFQIGNGDITLANVGSYDTVDYTGRYQYVPYENNSSDEIYLADNFLSTITTVHGSAIRKASKYGNFNSTKPDKATAVELTNRLGDYGVIGSNPSVVSGYSPAKESRQGTEYFAGLVSITSPFANSYVVGNANSNQIYVNGGGDYNIICDGLGNSSIYVDRSGGLIPDYGIGAQNDGKKISFAQNTKTTGGSTAYAYDRFNVGHCYAGVDYLFIKGTVTGIYFRKRSDATSKKEATCTAVITYTDLDGETRLLMLKDIIKKPTTTNASVSSQVFETNAVAMAALKIWHGKNAQTQLADDALKAKFYVDSALPEHLQAKVAALNAIYNHLADSNVYGQALANNLVSSSTKNGLFNTLGASDPLPADFVGFKGGG